MLNIERGGTPQARPRIRSYPGERARLRGVVWIQNGSDHVVLSDLNIEGPGRHDFGQGLRRRRHHREDHLHETGDVKELLDARRQLRRRRLEPPNLRRNRFHDCGTPEDDNLGMALDGLVRERTGREARPHRPRRRRSRRG